VMVMLLRARCISTIVRMNKGGACARVRVLVRAWREAWKRTRDKVCNALSPLRLQHYVEPLGHPDSTLDSTD